MAIGMLATGATAQEAERSVQDEYPTLRVVRSRRIEMATVQEHAVGSIGNDWWIVVVEGSALPDQEDPEGETEARFLADMGGALKRVHGE